MFVHEVPVYRLTFRDPGLEGLAVSFRPVPLDKLWDALSDAIVDWNLVESVGGVMRPAATTGPALRRRSMVQYEAMRLLLMHWVQLALPAAPVAEVEQEEALPEIAETIPMEATA